MGSFLEFLATAAASAVGLVGVKLGEAWVGAPISHAGFLEAERNADVIEIAKLAREIGEIGTKLWLKDRPALGDELDEALVTAKIAELGSAVDLLFGNNLGLKDSCSLDVDRLDEAVTSGMFGSIGRRADQTRVSMILTTSSAVAMKVKECRRKLKPHWFASKS